MIQLNMFEQFFPDQKVHSFTLQEEKCVRPFVPLDRLRPADLTEAYYERQIVHRATVQLFVNGVEGYLSAYSDPASTLYAYGQPVVPPFGDVEDRGKYTKEGYKIDSGPLYLKAGFWPKDTASARSLNLYYLVLGLNGQPFCLECQGARGHNSAVIEDDGTKHFELEDPLLTDLQGNICNVPLPESIYPLWEIELGLIKREMSVEERVQMAKRDRIRCQYDGRAMFTVRRN